MASEKTRGAGESRGAAAGSGRTRGSWRCPSGAGEEGQGLTGGSARAGVNGAEMCTVVGEEGAACDYQNIC